MRGGGGQSQNPGPNEGHGDKSSEETTQDGTDKSDFDFDEVLEDDPCAGLAEMVDIMDSQSCAEKSCAVIDEGGGGEDDYGDDASDSPLVESCQDNRISVEDPVEGEKVDGERKEHDKDEGDERKEVSFTEGVLPMLHEEKKEEKEILLEESVEEPDKEVVSEGFDPPLVHGSNPTRRSCSPEVLTSLEPGQKSFKEWESLVDDDGEDGEDEVREQLRHHAYHHHHPSTSTLDFVTKPDAKDPSPPRSTRWRPPPVGCSSDDLDNTTDDDNERTNFRYDSLEDLGKLLKEADRPSVGQKLVAAPVGLSSPSKRALPAVPTDISQQLRAMRILSLAPRAELARKISSSSNQTRDSLEDVRAYFPDGQCEDSEDGGLGRSDMSEASLPSIGNNRKRLLPAIPGAADDFAKTPTWLEQFEEDEEELEDSLVLDNSERAQKVAARARQLLHEDDSGFISLDVTNGRRDSESVSKPSLTQQNTQSSSDFLWVGLDKGAAAADDGGDAGAVVRRPKNHARLMEHARRRLSAPPGAGAEQQLSQAAPAPSLGAKDKIKRRKSDRVMGSATSTFCRYCTIACAAIFGYYCDFVILVLSL